MQRVQQSSKLSNKGNLLIGCGVTLLLLLLCGFLGLLRGGGTSQQPGPTATAQLVATATPPPVPTPTQSPVSTPAQSASVKPDIRYVSADGDGVYIRSKPDLEARVKVWPDGTEMTVLEQENDWCKVQAPDGYVGYVPAKYLAFIKPEVTVQKVTPTAIASVETLKWSAIEAVYNDQSLTQAQRHDYLAGLKGQQVVLWRGTVCEVKEFLGDYSVYVSVDMAGGKCNYQVSWDIRSYEIQDYRKGQAVTFSGTISSVYTSFGLMLGLKNVTVQK